MFQLSDFCCVYVTRLLGGGEIVRVRDTSLKMRAQATLSLYPKGLNVILAHT